MGAFTDYIEHPTARGARSSAGWLSISSLTPRTAPPPPGEIDPAHRAALQAGYYL